MEQEIQNEDEVIDSTTDTSTDDVNTDEVSNDDIELIKQKLQQQEELNKKLYQRAKKAEEKLKITKTTDPNDKDELRLIARGLSDDEIDVAKRIAKGSGTTLIEALKDPIFIAYQEKQKEAQSREQAKLGASNGSSYEDTKLVTSNMSRDDHKNIWKKYVK